jgi:hypothetical protein
MNLNSLPFVHLFSEVDTDFHHELLGKSIPAQKAGFCECKSDTVPAISLGWGWYMHSHSNKLLVAPDEVRSNVMLIDKNGYDVGAPMTRGLLSAWLTVYDWQAWVCTTLCGSASLGETATGNQFGLAC